MKQIKFLLAFFVLALGGQLKAVTLPETSEGDKVAHPTNPVEGCADANPKLLLNDT